MPAGIQSQKGPYQKVGNLYNALSVNLFTKHSTSLWLVPGLHGEIFSAEGRHVLNMIRFVSLWGVNEDYELN